MSWFTAISAMQPGDRCEFRYPAREEWLSATVVVNGGAGYWRVKGEDGREVTGLYAEHVRPPGGPDCGVPA